MTPYRDWDHDSGISAYEIGLSHIDIQFKSGGTYRYTALLAGQENINQMARLARAGDGLNAFINNVLKRRYGQKL